MRPLTECATEKPMFKIGEEVIWSHQPHGGYGYLIAVPAVVVGVTEKRVRIAAQRQNQPPKLVTVRPENLRRNA
jgi:hypothetical protein